MKNIILFIMVGLFISSCKTPAEPIGISYTLVSSVDTGGFCRDINIKDSIVVAAADEKGYQVYSFNLNNFEFTHKFGETEMGRRSNNVVISSDRDYFLSLDKTDHIYAMSLNDENDFIEVVVNFGSDNRDYCRSLALVENEQNTIIYTLNRSVDGNSTIVYTRLWDNAMLDGFGGYHALPWGATFTEVNGLNIEANAIFFSDSLLYIANSQLGVKVLKQNLDGSLFEFTEFDTQGEVTTIYANDGYVFAGSTYDSGCLIASVNSDSNVSIIEPVIAKGYTINGTHLSNGILAFACGYDGVVLYNWDNNGSELIVSELGRVQTEDYAYQVKIYDNETIFVAGRNGLSVYNIER
jgi:hypothetical protein